MSIRVNGSTISKAFLRVGGAWRPAVAAWGKVDGEWRKVYPYVPPSPPITGASISPSSRTWTAQATNDFRAAFTGSASGGTGPFVYNWSATGDAFIRSGQGTSSVSVGSTSGAPATVRLTVDDQGSGTSASATARPINEIPAPSPLVATVSPSSRTWSGSLGSFTTTFTGSGAGGSGSYGYNWSVSNGGTVQSGQGTANVTVASNNGQAVTVTLTLSDTVSGTSTTASGSVAAVVWPTLTVSVSPSSLSGSGSTGTVVTSGSATATVTGGSGSFTETWEWDGGAANGAIVPTTPGARTTTFRSGDTQAPGTTRGRGFRYRVTDNVTGNVALSNSVGVDLVRTAAALVVSVSPASLTGSAIAEPVETTGSATVSVSGGSGSWTVQWVFDNTGTGGFNPISPTSATTRFRASPGQAQGTTLTGGWFPRVTDTVTGQTADGPAVSVSLTRNYSAMTVSRSPAALSGSSTSAPVTTAGSVTVSVSGGSGSWTVVWLYNNTGTGGPNPTAGTNATTAFVGASNQPAGSTATAGFFPRVTDTITGQVVDGPAVSITLSRNYVNMTASAAPGSLSGSSASAIVVTSGSATCTVSGGSGNVSYQWEWDGGNNSGSIVATNPSSPTTTFQSGESQPAGTTRGAGLRCRVTDNVTGQVVVTNSVGVNLTRTGVMQVRIEGDAIWSQTGAFTGSAFLTAVVTNGSPNFTYEWSYTSGVDISFNPNGLENTEVRTTNRGQSGVVRVRATGSNGQSATSADWVIEPGG